MTATKPGWRPRWSVLIDDECLASGPGAPDDPADVAHAEGMANAYRVINPHSVVTVDWRPGCPSCTV